MLLEASKDCALILVNDRLKGNECAREQKWLVEESSAINIVSTSHTLRSGTSDPAIVKKAKERYRWQL